MRYCDLHTHTNFSDGSDSPYELCKKAKKIGLCALAITDHNTVKGIFEFEKSAKEFDLDYILGSELTTEYKHNEVHVLCLGINENNAHSVADFTESVKENKRKSNLILAENLRKAGYDVYLENLEERFGKNINRAHFARALLEIGAVKEISEAFDGILKEGNGFYVPNPRPDMIKTVSLIAKWGCTPVLAHPLLNFTKEELEKALPQLKKAGLIGMEVYYSKFSSEQREYLRYLCEKYDLIPSGGSDYHGENKSEADLGSASVPYSCCEMLKCYVEMTKNLG